LRQQEIRRPPSKCYHHEHVPQKANSLRRLLSTLW